MIRLWLLGLIAIISLISCTSAEELEYKEAESAKDKGQFTQAIIHYEKTIRRAPKSKFALKSSREAARIASTETKDFKKAIEFYRHLVVYSKDINERTSAQRQIAQIYFDQLTDYNKAIVEYSRLLEGTHTQEELVQYRLSIARSYYYLNNFSQAESEVADLLVLPQINDQLKFDLLMLKGNIAMTQKDLTKAIDVYKQLVSEFPERAMAENVGLSLALCYEEIKDYKLAIETLETLKKSYSTPEYIEIRIKRLKDREVNLPGARGLRK